MRRAPISRKLFRNPSLQFIAMDENPAKLAL
jgi:hypothetical protein